MDTDLISQLTLKDTNQTIDEDTDLLITPITSHASNRSAASSILSKLNPPTRTITLDGFQSKITALEAEIAALLFDRSRLDVSWDEKFIPDNQYYPQAQKLAQKRAVLAEQLWAETVNLRNTSISQRVAKPITPGNDGVFYPQRINLYRDPLPTGKAIHRGGHGRLRREAIEIYGSDHKAPRVPGQRRLNGASVIVPIPQLYCPVYKTWFGHDEMTPAHILPQRISIAQVDYYFGAGFGSRKHSFDNCLFVHQEIDALMAQGLLVFVPAAPVALSPDGRQLNWKVKILRKKTVGSRKLVAIPGKTLKSMDGAELHWKNENRPSTRFLYFHYLISHLRNKEQAHLGFAEDWEEMVKSGAFSQLGPFWNRAHLEAVMDYAGHVRDEDVARIAEGTTTAGGKKAVRELTTGEANEYVRRLL